MSRSLACQDTPASTLQVPLTALGHSANASDGRYTIFIAAMDAAGNEGGVVATTVTRDTVPPNTTSVVIKEHNVYVDALGGFVVSSGSVDVVITADKPMSRYDIGLVGDGGSRSGGSVTAIAANEAAFVASQVLVGGMGQANVTVKVEDLAGNVDPAGYNLSIIVIGGTCSCMLWSSPSIWCQAMRCRGSGRDFAIAAWWRENAASFCTVFALV